ncbi:WcaI family glycosyltransferase [Qipengyuania flava]|uniref:WcaI family glycosyltransferase n=1 Tax=Qipengyuania flava TaxID=192812 RepID=UPI001C63B368|nr:WcaI family glycosyltransferase [Qipengyuania flava]QYJ07523.1 WcaI family glycosyltransferase [Qipengyuania flava]
MSAGRPRKILFIGLNYAPEPIGIGPYSAGLCEGLVERGHEVRAIVGQPYYPAWKLFDRFKGRWMSSVENGVKVTRCPHYIPANPSGRKRLAHHMSFASSCYPPSRMARRDMRPDIVVTVAPSMVAAPVAVRMARRAGVPLWLHIQDFEVGAALATGLIDRDGRTAQAAASFENRMLQSADIVSTISRPMCELAEAKGVPRDRIIEIRNWANHLPAIQAASGRSLRAEWGLEGKTIVLYSGNIANKQGLDVVVDAARLLEGREDIAFVVVGEGPNRINLERRAKGLRNLQFRDLQSPERVGSLLRMADIHLLPQLADAADLVLPSKLGNMLASGRPIVATVMPGTGVAQELVGCGVIVPPETPQAIADAIASLAGHADYRRTMGEHAIQRAKAAWSKTAVLDRFEQRLEELLG